MDMVIIHSQNLFLSIQVSYVLKVLLSMHSVCGDVHVSNLLKYPSIESQLFTSDFIDLNNLIDNSLLAMDDTVMFKLGVRWSEERLKLD